MGRKCSHCGNYGHNLRTCSSHRSAFGGGGGGGLKLFGVQVYAASALKKSFSTECLNSCYLASSSASPSSSSSSSLVSTEGATEKISYGYLSDGLLGRAQDRRKGDKKHFFSFLFFFQNSSKSQNIVQQKILTEFSLQSIIFKPSLCSLLQ